MQLSYHFFSRLPYNFSLKLPLASLWRRAHARNVSLFNYLRWPIYVFNSVVHTKFLAKLAGCCFVRYFVCEFLNSICLTTMFFMGQSLCDSPKICSVVGEQIHALLRKRWWTDWLADWLTYILTDWLTDWWSNNPADWFTDCLTDWLTEWVSDWLTDWFMDWLTDWSTDYMTDWLIIWLTDCLTARSFDWLTDQKTGWLNDWQTDWLTDCLTGGLTD